MEISQASSIVSYIVTPVIVGIIFVIRLEGKINLLNNKLDGIGPLIESRVMAATAKLFDELEEHERRIKSLEEKVDRHEINLIGVPKK